MKWILIGAVLGLLLILCPAFLVGLVAALVSQPVVMAFVAGLVCRKPLGRRMRSWAG
ncbi:hypothetical protein [Streptomyces sp. NPDC058614]|uniref:hypothetical protein n=1 Tax=Streptomyces sp. NPDC058614 TaxID=3346557 RepID=UPI00365020BA